ncbi:MAG: aminopeptidase P family protein [Prevotellaceae bacterium]|jgi:Xaa-Pro aminopeptidase|nr:aminopeptidase P family protein [Prevotellaceae bacterium]
MYSDKNRNRANLIQDRLKALRAELKLRNFDAIIIYGSDPHFSEYLANRWKYRKWLSGFTGTSGTLIVTADRAALWVDSRYFIQAANQLQDTGIEMQKIGTGLPDESWLKTVLAGNARVGVDAELVSISRFNMLKTVLAPLTVEDTGDIFDKIYTDRPSMPNSEIFLLPDEITGKSRKEKIADFKNTSAANGEICIISTLDDIAWILNMRGADITCNPLAIAFLIIESASVHLFLSSNRISEADCKTLSNDGIIIHTYNDFYACLSNISKNKTVKIDFDRTNCRIFKILNDNGVKIIESSIDESIALKKSVKNTVELAGFRECMITDGVAMLRFCKWLNENIGKIKITETDAARKLEEYRQSGKNFKGLSFRTISAYGANAALPHYASIAGSDAEIKTDTFYLLDSGAQYLTGTTDLTRTMHFGEPTAEEKEDYTLVLKGMIAMSMAVFPSKTRGSQLDILARKFLWEKGKNYLHGTGHGVGHFLCVHEGPQSIRCEENPVALQPGMVISNEPAIYVEGKYGLRIENLITCKEHCRTAFGNFYSFETLTLCPIDIKALDISLMSREEICWLNDYHRKVYNLLSPHLSTDEIEYLAKSTKPL